VINVQVSKSPLNPVQTALLTILGADATLTGLLGAAGRILDDVPEGQAYPYVVLGDHLSTLDGSHTSFGRQVSETLHIWTKKKGNKTGQDILARIDALLNNQPDRVTDALTGGLYCVRIFNEFDQALRDPDPQIRHHVVRFRIITGQRA
jgi:hypothetical protein